MWEHLGGITDQIWDRQESFPERTMAELRTKLCGKEEFFSGKEKACKKKRKPMVKLKIWKEYSIVWITVKVDNKGGKS